jgi:UDP-N-acetylglucosamine--N-acetylmuramyl-(pentapeptide) pyrophosphoryl-undecaprenol N-acetylglucosamine transferase
MLGKNATKIFVAIDGMGKFFPSNKIIQTGNPVREAIVNSKLSREEAILFFGLDPNKKTVLAIGGSLGAKNINEALARGISEFEKNDIQLIWQTGKPFVEKGRAIANGKSNIWVNDFITQMENAYGAADIVISRSGAMSIAELAVMKKPAVLVPFPFAAEDHQTVNAQRLVDKNAAIMIPDSAALNQLVSTVVDLSKNDDKQQALKKNISQLAVNNADEVIAKEILNALNKTNE